mmetsp:Transcript_8760/g.24167  ORF Transcript_8760/g.24167 Transcript_8760/m.24167 type:complete len:353 (+) Transcript_8760:59-1117(+)
MPFSITLSSSDVLASLFIATGVANVWILMRALRELRDERSKRQTEHNGQCTASNATPAATTKAQLRTELTRLASEKNAGAPRVPTMEDVVRSRAKRNETVYATSPAALLNDLRTGNMRFWTGTAVRPELSAMERRALILQQAPKVAVLGCADSRVPIEIVFDQGLGDIFAIRVAGNVHGINVQGSLDYAIHHLRIKLVVVMGHEGCGAVKAAQLPEDQVANEEPMLRSLLTTMKADLASHSATLEAITDAKCREREAVAVNTQAQVLKILREPAVRGKVQRGELMVVGAFYEISSGLVEFFDPIAPDDLDTCVDVIPDPVMEKSVQANTSLAAKQVAAHADNNDTADIAGSA